MIKVQNNIATREPLPAFLRGLKTESLLDLSWTDPVLRVQDSAWWPEDRDWPELQEGERYTDEVLIIDADRKVVVSKRQAEPDPDYVPPRVETVTNAQGTAALIQAGIWQAVLDYVDGIQDPVEKALADVALNKTTEWRRDSEFLNTAASKIGLSEQQLDDLFTEASKIQL